MQRNAIAVASLALLVSCGSIQERETDSMGLRFSGGTNVHTDLEITSPLGSAELSKRIPGAQARVELNRQTQFGPTAGIYLESGLARLAGETETQVGAGIVLRERILKTSKVSPFAEVRAGYEHSFAGGEDTGAVKLGAGLGVEYRTSENVSLFIQVDYDKPFISASPLSIDLNEISVMVGGSVSF